MQLAEAAGLQVAPSPGLQERLRLKHRAVAAAQSFATNGSSAGLANLGILANSRTVTGDAPPPRPATPLAARELLPNKSSSFFVPPLLFGNHRYTPSSGGVQSLPGSGQGNYVQFGNAAAYVNPFIAPSSGAVSLIVAIVFLFIDPIFCAIKTEWTSPDPTTSSADSGSATMMTPR